MPSFDFAGFEEFVNTKRLKIRAIARATHGEHTAEDMENEALLAALEVGEKDCVPVAFEIEDHRQLGKYDRCFALTKSCPKKVKASPKR